MDTLNLEKLSSLVVSSRNEGRLKKFQKDFSFKYYKKNNTYQESAVLKEAIRINKIYQKRRENSQEEAQQEEHPAEKQIPSFIFGELKVFTWIVTAYCSIHQCQLEDLTEQHLQDISSYFPTKPPIFIKYEVLCLIHNQIKIKQAPSWSKEEKQLLTKIVESKQTAKEWRQISYNLFCLSECEFYRHFQECREMWINHLDSNVNRSEWTLEEDLKLMQGAEVFNCKWAQIFQEFQGKRTQHMIKNRYNSLKRKYGSLCSEKHFYRDIIKAIKSQTQTSQEKMEQADQEALKKGSEQGVKEERAKGKQKGRRDRSKKEERTFKLTHSIGLQAQGEKQGDDDFFMDEEEDKNDNRNTGLFQDLLLVDQPEGGPFLLHRQHESLFYSDSLKNCEDQYWNLNRDSQNQFFYD